MKRIVKSIISITIALMMAFSITPLSGLVFAKSVDQIPPYEFKVGDTIVLGSYPQTEIKDEETLAALNGIEKEWISYDYYTGTGNRYDGQMESSDYMKYADISYNGEKYRAVTFTQYRPYCTGYISSAENSNQDENGYTPNKIYFFKYEPLKWRVLDPNEGLIMCESIIDSQAFNNIVLYDGDAYYGDSAKSYYASNWATSYLREWINNGFYNLAFSQSEKSVIKTVHLENKSIYNSLYDAPSTNDKVFVLSYWDMKNSNYGFGESDSAYDVTRRAPGTDYSKCQGLFVYRSSGSSYDGNSDYRGRSPYHSSITMNVGYRGNIYSSINTEGTANGIRPVMSISLDNILKYNLGDIIEFGSYPQSEVKDEETLAALNGIEKEWISYDYYTGTGNRYDGQMESSDYMKYADISYNGEKYRAVTFTQYRPYYTGNTSSAANTYQDENGYTPNNVYYFKYEPIKWRILDPSEGLVMCESIIDSQAFNNYILYDGSEYYGDSEKAYYSTNWAKSSLRAWLNDDFYNTSFSLTEKNSINVSNLENKSYNSSKYDAPNTSDRVFLLSYWDMINDDYGYNFDSARKAYGTDYANCQGLTSSLHEDKYSGMWSIDGSSPWRLRTPYDSFWTMYLEVNGGLFAGCTTHTTFDAIRPALRIKLPKTFSVSIDDLTVDFKTSAKLDPQITVDEGIDYTVTYSSSDLNIVTVEKDGTVFGNGEGTAVITVEVTDLFGNVVSDTCTVTVNAPKVKSVTIEDASINYLSTIVIKPTITSDEGAYYTVSYSSSNTSVAMVDENGKVTSVKQSGLSRGSTVITCTVTDSNGNVVTDTCTVTVNFAWWQWLIKIVLFGWIWY